MVIPMRKLEVIMVGVFNKVQDLSEQASRKSGVSYDDYIRLFSSYCDNTFGYQMSKRIQKMVNLFGYVPLAERNNIGI